MIAKEKRLIKPGDSLTHLFPSPLLGNITKKQDATVSDTIRFIPQVVRETLFHTAKLAQRLKGVTAYETCKNIWHFVYEHIAYRKDEEGKEQVRSPARTWHDRHQGVDCDCYSVFISSILSNLKIRHKLRITKYGKDFFQHIYPVVPMPDGSQITIDCVVSKFNYEEPYTEKKDTSMDLEYLNGVGDTPNFKNSDAFDLMGLMDDNEAMAELGRLFKKKTAASGLKPKLKIGAKIKTVAKKALHVTNRVNPATVALRAGVLASMKLNILKVAERLKWGYLSEADAKKKGVDMPKFKRLKTVLEKLEKIFYGAGGKPENLKKAILTGKGNKNKEVSGLGYAPDLMDGLDESSSLSRIIGKDVYYSENINGLEGLQGLGEPATAASVAAASGVMATIATLIKSIGSIFPKKDKSGDAADSGGANNETGAGEDGDPNPAAVSRQSQPAGDGSSGDSSGDDPDASGDSKAGFWEKNKTWLKPTAIGVGTLGLLLLAVKLLKPAKSGKPTNGLAGTPKKKKAPAKKKTTVALM